MAASMCDVFSFCVGVAGGARGSVEVRFVSSAKVRSGRTPPGEPRRGPMHTFWSPGPSAPVWFLLGPGGAGSVLVPRLVAISRGVGRRSPACAPFPEEPGPLAGGRAAAVLGGIEALGGPGVEGYPGPD